MLQEAGGAARRFVGLSSRNQRPLTLADALWEEGHEIHGAAWGLPDNRAQHEKDRLRQIYARMHELGQCALCLSGGGIRSAAFALGVMQTLAGFPEAPSDPKRRLLRQFHYLSTVSGGGYIGGWLTAWLSREQRSNPTDSVTRVLDAMSRRGDEVEPIQIANLRENSSYLTPQAGWLSGDMWAAIGTLVRNLLVNWTLILPVLVALVLGAKIISWLIGRMVYGDVPDWTVGAIMCAMFVLALSYRVANRPSIGVANRPVGQFILWHIVPAIIAAQGFAILIGRSVRFEWTHVWWHYALAGMGAYLVAWLAGRSPLWRSDRYGRPQSPSHRRTDWIWWTLSGAIFGVLVWIEQSVYATLSPTWSLRAVVIVGPPMIIIAQMIAEMCFTAVISLKQETDDDREWLARAGGMYVLISVLGSLFFSLVILAPMTYETAQGVWTTWLASIGGVAGLFSAVMGASSFTAIGGSKGSGNGQKRGKLDLIVKIGAPLFGAALFLATSLAIDAVLFQGRFENTGLFGDPSVTGQALGPIHDREAIGRLWWALGISIFLLLFIPWRVNINRFSLHSFYRNRLIRAFLAASRTTADNTLDRPLRNCLTDIDPEDNMRMHELWRKGAAPTGDLWRPLHVVNMALNIVSSRKLAWQQRKAEPFTVTPLHSGSGCSTFDGPGAFQPTESYGGPEGVGISLGTAMAISGAAASPNMGYHSSASVTFLMALFNVRLGWWLANPSPTGDGRYATDGPRWALSPFLSEMFGRTEDDRHYVYLSDGGHFENLGLYEMVRRRCRFVVVSDASQDKDFTFGSLGDSVRKIGIDLGIRIEMIGLDALKKRSDERETPGDDGPCHAMGLIHYGDVDGPNVEDGLLLYIKPGIHWRENAGVQNYAATHADFPHESTGNQWFTESQFESYRRLGVDTTWALVEKACKRAPSGNQATLPEILRALLDQAAAEPAPPRPLRKSRAAQAP